VAQPWIKRAIGLIHYQRGQMQLARRYLADSLEAARSVEARGWWLADALVCVAQLEIDSRRFSRAATLLRQGLDVSIALGDQRMIARCLERLAHLAAAQGRHTRGIQLASAANALRTTVGQPRSPLETRMVTAWMTLAEEALEPASREYAREQGATCDLGRVLADGLDERSGEAEACAGLTGPSAQPGVADDLASSRVDPLSPREREVARLVARGLSNPRIATELIIGERTVQTHVGNILAKLGFSSRVQLATWVTQHSAATPAEHNP
jgi:DNA-binding CsgD family transcriptional regulator